jgi:hypothetical protein
MTTAYIGFSDMMRSAVRLNSLEGTVVTPHLVDSALISFMIMVRLFAMESDNCSNFCVDRFSKKTQNTDVVVPIYRILYSIIFTYTTYTGSIIFFFFKTPNPLYPLHISNYCKRATSFEQYQSHHQYVIASFIRHSISKESPNMSDKESIELSETDEGPEACKDNFSKRWKKISYDHFQMHPVKMITFLCVQIIPWCGLHSPFLVMKEAKVAVVSIFQTLVHKN